MTCHLNWEDKSRVFGPEVKLAGGEDTPTSLVVKRSCALNGSAADSATWVGWIKEYLFNESDSPARDMHYFVKRRGSSLYWTSNPAGKKDKDSR